MTGHVRLLPLTFTGPYRIKWLGPAKESAREGVSTSLEHNGLSCLDAHNAERRDCPGTCRDHLISSVHGKCEGPCALTAYR